MNRRRNIALVAHDNRKRDLIEWVEWNYASRPSCRRAGPSRPYLQQR